MSKILITYATKTDTTKEVSLEIGDILTQNGLEVDVLPISDVNNLSGYEGVVVGAPINGMKWLPEAIQFVEDNQKELNDKTTAYFMVSYLIIEGRGFWKRIIKSSLSKISEIVNPVKVGMFGGRIESGFPTAARLLFGVKKDASLDVRDWNAIRAWAEELATYYKSEKQK